MAHRRSPPLPLRSARGRAARPRTGRPLSVLVAQHLRLRHPGVLRPRRARWPSCAEVTAARSAARPVRRTRGRRARRAGGTGGARRAPAGRSGRLTRGSRPSHSPGRSMSGSDTTTDPRHGAAAGARSPDTGGGSPTSRRMRRACAGAPVRVADGPQPVAVAHADAGLHRIGDPQPARRLLDEPDRPLESGDRVVLEAERQREVEQQLGVGRPADLREERRVHGQQPEVPIAIVPGSLVGALGQARSAR
jgi:hypothetical protein